VSHFVGFFCSYILKSAYSTNSLFMSNPDTLESIRPMYVVYFFEPFFSGIAMRIYELGIFSSSFSSVSF